MAVAGHHRLAHLLALSLDHALELIEQGWTQGAYWRSSTGGDCEPEEARRVDLAHALVVAARRYDVDEEELRQLVTSQLAEPYRSDRILGLEQFNDAPGRGKGEVRMVLLRTMRSL